MLRNIFKLSYQRAIVPDYHGFFTAFYEKLLKQDSAIAELFRLTDMENQKRMLMHSMSCITGYSATMEADEELEHIARLHGRERLNLPVKFYDIWLECLIDTIRDKDPKYNEHIERAWREVMNPGIEYMKSFCDPQKD